MIPQRLSAAVDRLLRAMPRNPDVIELGEALKEARSMVTAAVTGTNPGPKAVTVVTAKRDRAKYMRNYRSTRKTAANK